MTSLTPSLATSQWAHYRHVVCKLCDTHQRMPVGFRPWISPLNYDGQKQSRAFADELNTHAGAVGGRNQWTFVKCRSCHQLHGNWERITEQQYVQRLEGKKTAANSNDASTNSNDNDTTATSERKMKRLADVMEYMKPQK
eukprot:PhM_4_TR16717/c0_g1_i1/m.104896